MGNLTLNGATSGQITLAPTAVAGTNTITLPAATGTLLTTAGGQTISGTVTLSTLTSPAATNLTIQSAGTTAMTIDTSQNVGIGTTSPAFKLDVNSNANINGTAVMSSPYTMRNKIINGAMYIDQRNAGASQTIIGGASTLAFNCDRWQVRSAGANATVQQISTNNLYRMRFTGAASVSAVAAQQSIEALNCVDLAGGSATLSLVASSTSLTSLTLEAYYANTTNSFGTWGSPTVTSISSTSITISSTESTFSWTFSVPSAATTGIQIRITGGSLGASQTLTIGNVQLERGTVATPFEYRNYQQELAMCQRYYQIYSVTGANSQPVCMAMAYSTSAAFGSFMAPVPFRAVPTLTSSGMGVYNSGASNAGGTVALDIASTNSLIRLNVTGATGLSAGNAAGIYVSGTGSYAAFSAEL